MNAASLLPGLPGESRILILRLRSMGDIVLLTPALRLLKEWRGDLRVSVAVEPRFRHLLEGNPRVDETLSAAQGSGWGKMREQARLLRTLRARKFALCLNLHGGPTSTFLAQFSGARWKVGFEHFRRRMIYDVTIPDARRILDQTVVHTAEHQAAALFWLGVPRRPAPPSELFVTEAGRSAWRKERERLGIAPGRDYALLHPPALYFTKQWPPERFAKLGRYLEDELGVMAVFSCGPGENGSLDEVGKATGRAIRRVDAPSLATLMAAIAEARLFVGNDSGPAHVAAALKVPLVVIFGSSNSKIWRPWAGSGTPHRSEDAPGFAFQTVQNNYDCNPCPGDHCYRFSRPECILSVTFEQVRSAVDRVLHEVLQPRAADSAADRLVQ
ncbi:MAG TPA: glycosyltransferase family 9 protein [Terriglobia bacterium]|nr:glycosyltransferase family 9 protein [Terriglobia bacterium]